MHNYKTYFLEDFRLTNIIIVIPRPEHEDYKAFLEVHPENWGAGSTINAAVGNVVRCSFETLALEDRYLQVELGVHWDNMSDFELGLLVTRDRNVGIAVDVKGFLAKKSRA